MELGTIYLRRKELRRFLEIANGDTSANNTPEEDSLFRNKLIRECLLVTADLSTGKISADERAVVLSDLGKEYYAQYMNEQDKKREEAERHKLTTALTILEIAVAIAAIVLPYILSTAE